MEVSAPPPSGGGPHSKKAEMFVGKVEYAPKEINLGEA